MEFSVWLLTVLKRIAKIDAAQSFTRYNDDGVFELELVAVMDQQVAPIATINEHANEVEAMAFELKIDLLENAIKAQEAEDEENEAKIRGILERLTQEERLLIERPLPEDLPLDEDHTEFD